MKPEPFEEVVARLVREGLGPEEVVDRVAGLPDVEPWVREDPNRLAWLEGEVVRYLPRSRLKR